MTTASAPLAPTRWLRLPRRTARLRLTLLYSGMFLVLGTVLIICIYVFVVGTSGVQAIGAVPAAPAIAQKLIDPSIAQGQHDADVGRLLAASWVVLALSAIGSAVLGWFISGRVLRPVRKITATARTISAGSLQRRLALTGPDDE